MTKNNEDTTYEEVTAIETLFFRKCPSRRQEDNTNTNTY